MQVPKPVRMGYEEKTPTAQAQVGEDLWEMHGAGVKLLEFCAGRTAGHYESMEVLRAAITLLLTVMNDAAKRLAAQDAETAAHIVGMTPLHAIVQNLDGSDAGVDVWRYIERDLPELVGSVAEALERWHEGF